MFEKYKIEAVFHFAAYAYVGESVTEPEKYYDNNVANTLNLLKVLQIMQRQQMRRCQIKHVNIIPYTASIIRIIVGQTGWKQPQGAGTIGMETCVWGH